MENLKERMVLLLNASAVLFVSIIFIVRFICAYMYSSITCQQNYLFIVRNPNQNTPGVKKVAAKNLKKAMLKKM